MTSNSPAVNAERRLIQAEKDRDAAQARARHAESHAAEADRDVAEIPPQLSALLSAAQAFSRTCDQVDHAGLEVEAEELDTAGLAAVLDTLNTVRSDLETAVARMGTAVGLHAEGGPAGVSMAEAGEAFADVGWHLRSVAEELNPGEAPSL